MHRRKNDPLPEDDATVIMIVDDSADIRNVLSEIFHSHNYRVCSFTNGREALKALKEKPPDLILLDVKMPDMDGYKLCRHLKADGHSRDIPVIFISGLDDTADKIKGFQAGGVDYVTKPFQAAEILARVDAHLALNRLQKQLAQQNIHLHKEIAERRQAEKELRKHKAHLEETVSVRTIELKNINEELQYEIAERRRVEDALEQANFKLHSLVYEYGLRHHWISLFNRMSEELQMCSSFEQAYPIINQFAHRLIPRKAGALFMMHSSGNSLEVATSWGKTIKGDRIISPDSCRALVTRKVQETPDSPASSSCLHLAGVTGRNCLCVPLLAQDEIIGMLHLQQSASPEKIPVRMVHEDALPDFGPEMQRLAVTLARYLSLALANIKLRSTLQQQANHDPLTGIFNRRYMEETLKREMYRSERHKTPLGIIMLDLDSFRQFNNNFGHEAGDLVLRELAKFLQNNIRKEDVACRYGGEEFTLILPGASLPVTQSRAEILRRTVQNMHINYEGKTLDKVTISAGVAIFPDHGATGDAVLRAADLALYSAKHAGSNRVMVPG